MDQLRVAMRWLKAQHFWVLTVLAVIVAITCWYLAAGTLSAEFQSNKQQIVAQFSAQTSLQQQPFHPNEQIIEQQQAEIAKLSENVQAAWEKLYNRQRENVLKWPAALPEEFLQYIEDKNFGDAIRGDYLELYQNYARRHFPELPKIVDAKDLKESDNQSGNYGGGQSSHDWRQYLGDGADDRSSGIRSEEGDPTEDEDFTVIWLDQGRIKNELAWSRRPSAIRIWVTQEDLWVYHTLLRAVANTNQAKGADRFANAAIRGIEALEVGKPAGSQSRSQGNILVIESELKPTMQGEMGESYTEEAAAPIESEAGAYAGEGGEGSSEGDEQTVLLSGRYLDTEGRPMPTAPSTDSEQFRRLPVRMVLFMDQRWLSYFLTECANSPLPVEVQEVHINPQTQSGGGGFSGGNFTRGHDNSSGSGGQVQVELFDRYPNLVRVVIQGIVYIYNKPNTDILQVADAGAQP